MPGDYWNPNTALHDELLADAIGLFGRFETVIYVTVLRHLPLKAGLERLAEIRRAAAQILPGSRVWRRFYRRYTLAWDRPGGGSCAPPSGRVPLCDGGAHCHTAYQRCAT